MVVLRSISKDSMSAISAKSSRCCGLRARLRAVWCAPPAEIQAVAADFQIRLGYPDRAGNGQFGERVLGSHQVHLIDNQTKAVPRSITEAFTALPLDAVNTNLTGSALPPIERGWISADGVFSASEGHTSSMCAPKT